MTYKEQVLKVFPNAKVHEFTQMLSYYYIYYVDTNNTVKYLNSYPHSFEEAAWKNVWNTVQNNLINILSY
jgi:hypothetical protein